MVWSLVAVVLAVAGVWGGTALYQRFSYGIRYGEQEQNINVGVQDIFTLVVPDRGASVAIVGLCPFPTMQSYPKWARPWRCPS